MKFLSVFLLNILFWPLITQGQVEKSRTAKLSGSAIGIFAGARYSMLSSFRVFKTNYAKIPVSGFGDNLGATLIYSLNDVFSLSPYFGISNNYLSGSFDEFIGYGDNQGQRVEVYTQHNLISNTFSYFFGINSGAKITRNYPIRVFFNLEGEVYSAIPKQYNLSLDQNAIANGINYKYKDSYNNTINYLTPISKTVNVFIGMGINYEIKINDRFSFYPELSYSFFIINSDQSNSAYSSIRLNGTLAFNFFKATKEMIPPIPPPAYQNFKLQLSGIPVRVTKPDSICEIIVVKDTPDFQYSKAVADKLTRIGYKNVFCIQKGNLYQVVIGPFIDSIELINIKDELRNRMQKENIGIDIPYKMPYKCK